MENSVIVLGIEIKENSQLLDKLIESNKLNNDLFDNGLEVLGLDDNYWALGLILSDNNNEYVKEIDIEVLNNYKSKIPFVIEILKKVDTKLFKKISKKHIKLFHTQRVC